MTDPTIKPLIIPDLTTATLETYIPKLGMTWTSGTQTADKDGKPFSRIFSTVQFPSAPSTVNQIDLGSYSEEYEGSFYYRVTTNFKELLYTSSRNLDNDDESFLRWQRTTNSLRKEEIYSPALLSSLTWIRPNVPTNIEQPTLDPYYLAIANPLILPIAQVGKAIKAEVSVTGSSSVANTIEVRLKDSQTDVGTLVTGNFFLTGSFIEIKLIDVVNPTAQVLGPELLPIPNGSIVSHHSVTINFYGKYKWTTVSPGPTLDTKTLIHPKTANKKARLKPPNQSQFKDNFWNSTPDNIELIQFANRSTNPQWT